MQPIPVHYPEPPHADPQSDPHDDIVAILRSESAPRTASDPSELNIGVTERISSAAPMPMTDLRSADLGPAELGPPADPLNDNYALAARAPRRSFGGTVARFALTVCVGIAATVAWQAYGDEAQRMLAGYAPQLLPSSPVQAQDANSDQPPLVPTQAAAEPAPAQAAPAQAAPVQPASAAAAPAVAAPIPAAEPAQAAASADLAPLIENMSRELASLREAIDQLKTAQRQMTRDLAKAAEQDAKRKIAAQTPPPPPPQQQRPITPQRSVSQLPPPSSVTQPQVYIPPPPPPPTQSVAEPYTPRPPRGLP